MRNPVPAINSNVHVTTYFAMPERVGNEGRLCSGQEIAFIVVSRL
jgi:hypothetical protein